MLHKLFLLLFLHSHCSWAQTTLYVHKAQPTSQTKNTCTQNNDCPDNMYCSRSIAAFVGITGRCMPNRETTRPTSTPDPHAQVATLQDTPQATWHPDDYAFDEK